MLICSIALVLLVAAIAESTVPIFNPSQQSFAFKDVDSVCSESYYNLKGLFAGVKMEGSFVEDGIAIKPAEVPVGSPCYGMSSSCCLTNEEKGMEPIVVLEYHQQLQSVLENGLSSCNRLGRDMERSLYEVLDETRILISKEISAIIGKEIPNELFQRFFQFLYRFFHMLDFCKLAHEIELQMRELFKYIAQTQSLPNGYCTLDDFEQYFVDTWYNSSVTSLVKTMNSIRLISETYQLTGSLIKHMKQHQFNQQCIDALFRVRHCSYCVGNHYGIRVCDGHCINTFRGCMVDLYELTPHLRLLQEKLQAIATIANTEIVPARLVQSSLMEFVHMTRHIMKISSTPSTINNVTCSIDDTSLVSHIEANRMLHSTESATTETLKNAMKGDMKCYNDMQSLLLELDEHMCGVEAKHIKYIRNKGCWNGTHSKGNYEYELTGKERSDQMNNPSFKRYPVPLSNSYSKRVSQLTKLIREMNQTNQFYECLQTDDEDCSLFVLECNNVAPPTIEGEFQSGSGSGSGSGYGRGHIQDTESTGGRSILLQLGGPRRYHDVMTTPPNEPNVIYNTSSSVSTIQSTQTSSIAMTTDSSSVSALEAPSSEAITTSVTTTTSNTPTPTPDQQQTLPTGGSATSTTYSAAIVLVVTAVALSYVLY